MVIPFITLSDGNVEPLKKMGKFVKGFRARNGKILGFRGIETQVSSAPIGYPVPF